MKKTILSIVIGLVCVCLSISFVSCGTGDSGNDNSSSSIDKTITNERDAIYAVKNYSFAGTNYVENKIAGELGFNNYYDPQYGTTEAEQNTDGSWTVTLKGTMSGYVDEYHDDFKTKKFEVTAKVTEEDDMPTSVYVREVR